jgi:hypothetical protein
MVVLSATRVRNAYRVPRRLCGIVDDDDGPVRRTGELPREATKMRRYEHFFVVASVYKRLSRG